MCLECARTGVHWCHVATRLDGVEPRHDVIRCRLVYVRPNSEGDARRLKTLVSAVDAPCPVDPTHVCFTTIPSLAMREAPF